MAIRVGGTIEVSTSFGGVQRTIELRPLAFGAAWKVLDLLIELALHRASRSPNGNHWTIEEKAELAAPLNVRE